MIAEAETLPAHSLGEWTDYSFKLKFATCIFRIIYVHICWFQKHICQKTSCNLYGVRYITKSFVKYMESNCSSHTYSEATNAYPLGATCQLWPSLILRPRMLRSKAWTPMCFGNVWIASGLLRSPTDLRNDMVWLYIYIYMHVYNICCLFLNWDELFSHSFL